MHFDDSVESIADSDSKMESCKKMLTSLLYAQESSGETRCLGRAGERGKCTIDSSRKRRLVEGDDVEDADARADTR